MRISAMTTIAAVLATFGPSAASEVDFNRDVRPILSDKCFHCHGPDSKNQDSEFRLDTRERIFADLGGYFGIVPGDLKASELHLRIRSEDEGQRMPPLDSNRSLSEEEKEILEAWIVQGAPYDSHWAFLPLANPELPKIGQANRNWTHNAIDVFVAGRLEQEGLSPAPMAERETLLRRASLALTGLQPTPEELATFLDDSSPQAYEQAIERMLSSLHYAERQALFWIDAARYADTDGYQNDYERYNWPWRDWVIKAFHENMPFDQFTIEQLAGDMLPNATDQQVLASAFNRNHRQNGEGGALAEEFFIENVIDRVETTSTVWLGLTMGCARCHDHKYDPLTQREFYQLFAYFNNIGEAGIGKGVDANPVRKIASPLYEPPLWFVKKRQNAEQAVQRARESLDSRFGNWLEEMQETVAEDVNDWFMSDIESASVEGGGELRRASDAYLFIGQSVGKVDYQIVARSRRPRITGLRIDALPHKSFGLPRKLSRSGNGNFVVSDIEVRVRFASGETISPKINRVVTSHEPEGHAKASLLDGDPNTWWSVSGGSERNDGISIFFGFEEPVDLGSEGVIELRLIHGSHYIDHNIGMFRVMLTDSETLAKPVDPEVSPEIRWTVRNVDGDKHKQARAELRGYYEKSRIDADLKAAVQELENVEVEAERLGFHRVPVMVMEEAQGDANPAYFLQRGQYSAPDKSEELTRQVPTALFADAPNEQPADRLELARWLVSEHNPLTPRVIVNRLWQQYFGVGLVKTVEDFGAQGEAPSHPQLLDWLASQLVDSGWDLKALHRQIATSATFCQASQASAAQIKRDPENRLLARGPRRRLDGFAIRDVALHSAGLLDSRVGGPPVKPYQPEGLWNAVSAGAEERYTLGKGADLYRKSLYTYWKRAVNPPRQIIFDAGGREVCNVSSRVTNTPLQALVLMNDPTFMEAARHVAQRALNESIAEPWQRLNFAYRLVVGRSADDETLNILSKNLSLFTKHFQSKVEDTETLLQIGDSQRDRHLDPAEHAAWSAVAHLILNLDESIVLE